MLAADRANNSRDMYGDTPLPLSSFSNNLRYRGKKRADSRAFKFSFM